MEMCAQYFAKDVSGSLARAGGCMVGCVKAEGEDVGKMVTRRDGRVGWGVSCPQDNKRTEDCRTGHGLNRAR